MPKTTELHRVNARVERLLQAAPFEVVQAAIKTATANGVSPADVEQRIKRCQQHL